VLFRNIAPTTALKELGIQFLNDVEELQQIFTSQIIFMPTPQRVKP
jgi:hypothetical protein